jgi:tRNA(adenine34) deaminase
MRQALSLAEEAAAHGEVPVGAVVAVHGQVVACARNEVEASGNPLDHAEKLALERAVRVLGRHGMTEADLYVTLEPCVMCSGSLVLARLRSVCFAARDERFGGTRSIYRLADDRRLNHRLEVREGLLAEEASGQLRNFFLNRRLHS